eukprot:TRINITY_DN81510_c0_g1_i1.p1 TRINITY_DN81510_c0_g1~~TRINITY_DN81510_c0_g1_i1.p1  ORF type:complete len:611 (-),score=245.42 TRINITY_DN81510_c0_g1_i1:126-1910(-)
MARLLRSLPLLLAPGVARALVLERQSTQKSNVDIVRDIQQRLDSEAKADADATEKLDCWCQKNLEAKQQLVDGSRSDIESLEHDIDAKRAANQQLEVELTSHEKDLDSNQQALETAKALREKDAQKFADDETSHSQALDALDNAMVSLNSDHGHDATARMAAMFSQNAVFLQSKAASSMATKLRGALAAKQTPDMVYGTLKQMKSTFSRELEDMRHSEAASQESHNELFAAKTAEINSLKKQVLDKKVRASQMKVQVTQQAEQKERSKALLESNVALLASMKELCNANSEAGEARKEARSAEVQGLADSLTDLVGAELLSVRAHQKQAPDAANVIGDLCLAAAGIADRDWKRRAKEACQKAKGGSLQAAADDVESLKDDIEVALNNATAEKQQCQRDGEEAKSQAASAAEATTAEANQVASEKAQDENNLKGLEDQVAGAQQAQQDLADAGAAFQALLQNIKSGAVHDANVLEKVRATAPAPATAKISEALKASDKLVDAAGSFVKSNSDAIQKTSGLFDGVVRAAKKAEIPLKLMHADAEEAEVKITEDTHADASLARVSCDLPSLSLKEQKLQEYIKHLGQASEGLTWQFLR